MNVSICSRRDVKRLLNEEFPQNTVVISFCDSMSGDLEEDGYIPVDYSGKMERYFQAAVLDIHYDELEDYGISYQEFFPEAAELAKFIQEAASEDLDIICQCEYGQSRSAGCAAAILEYYNHVGIKIFADYRYCPNQMIFHKVYDALKMINSDINCLEYT